MIQQLKEKDYFSSSISRWGENVSTLRKTTWHSRKLNLACIICGQCGARTHTRHSVEMNE